MTSNLDSRIEKASVKSGRSGETNRFSTVGEELAIPGSWREVTGVKTNSGRQVFEWTQRASNGRSTYAWQNDDGNWQFSDRWPHYHRSNGSEELASSEKKAHIKADSTVNQRPKESEKDPRERGWTEVEQRTAHAGHVYTKASADNKKIYHYSENGVATFSDRLPVASSSSPARSRDSQVAGSAQKQEAQLPPQQTARTAVAEQPVSYHQSSWLPVEGRVINGAPVYTRHDGDKILYAWAGPDTKGQRIWCQGPDAPWKV